MDEVAECAEALDGVRRKERSGLTEWRYRGRLVARQLDDEQLVIRSEFAYRAALLAESPATFSVPTHYAKHMMVVATLENADADLVREAIETAWQLQRSAD